MKEKEQKLLKAKVNSLFKVTKVCVNNFHRKDLKSAIKSE